MSPRRDLRDRRARHDCASRDRLLRRTAVGGASALLMRLCLGGVGSLVAAPTAAQPAAAPASGPCGGVRLDGGLVHLGEPMAAPGDGGPLEAACVRAVAAALAARPSLRSVTVAVRVLASQRAAGEAAAQRWRAGLRAGGVPEARVATIVPLVGDAGAAMTQIAYREPTPRPVAMVHDAQGEVRAGVALEALRPAARGSRLIAGDIAATEGAATARLALADGSFIAMAPATALRLGRVELGPDLKRHVEISLLRGRVEAVVVPQEGGRFELATGVALAGVRGTHFRVALASRGRTAVETVEGVVELAGLQGRKGRVLVRAGEVAWVDASGEPSRVRRLLGEAEIAGPQRGPVRRDVQLRWRPVQGAVRYLVELATDGEHALGARRFEVSAPAAGLPADLPAGAWFWRVFAIDDDGAVGMPSKAYRVVVGAP